jgi:uncharacterized SAM-binding protein YcdF (DUF218 family)
MAHSSASAVPGLATQSAMAIRMDLQAANPQSAMNRIRTITLDTHLNVPLPCTPGLGTPGFSRVLPRSNSGMLFFLRKLIEALLLPVGISALLTIAGVLFRRRWMAVAGVVALGAFSTEVVSRMVILPLERVYKPKTVSAAPKADAIVILNGGIVRGIAAPGIQWGSSANRFFAGIDLALAGKAKFLVISAGNLRLDGVILRQSALRYGIPPERIIVTPIVSTTEAEARAISEIPNIHSILLVTSAFHMPRAVLLFRARGLDVSPFPTDQRALGRWELASTEFIPSADPIQKSEDAMREYYGLALYRLVYLFRPLGRLRK